MREAKEAGVEMRRASSRYVILSHYTYALLVKSGSTLAIKVDK
jgi:hypothetical protein